MGGANIIDLVPATDQSVARSDDSRPTGRTIFSAVMTAARTWWHSNTAAELATIIGCDVRSAERYLAGDRTAGAEAVLKMLASDVGVRLVLVAVSRLPDARQQAFWTEMARAAKRAELLAERARIEKELAET